MNISGVVVRARPETIPGVRGSLGRIPGVEIHGATDDGRMVITLEQVNGRPFAETLLEVQNLDGVLSASLAYHYDDTISVEEEGDNGTDQA